MCCRRIVIAFLCFLAPGLLLHGQQAGAQRPLEATVVSATGAVEVKLPDQADWQPAQVAMKIPQGSTISTGVKSRAELDFAGHAAVIIRRPSIVRVDRFLISERAVKTQLHLQVGSLRAGVVKQRIASDFKVTTPVFTLSARGTEIADITHSERGTEVRMGEEGVLDATKYVDAAPVTRRVPSLGYTRSRDLIQVVDAKKMEQSYRSYGFGRSEAERVSASRDPSNLEDAKTEFNREAAHPEFQRVLKQKSALYSP